MTIAATDSDVRATVEHLRHAANPPMIAAHRGLRWSGVPENASAMMSESLTIE